MAHTIVKPSSFSSNKPHSPVPLPDPKLYPTKLEMCDGRNVWVSCPQPDKMTWIIDVHPDLYAEHVLPDAAPGLIANQLYGHLCNPALGLDVITSMSTVYPNPDSQSLKPSWGKIGLALGWRSSTVTISLIWKTKSIKLEMNPRKLGPKGFQLLASALCGANGPFNWSALVQRGRISRIDYCVDLVGVRPDEVVVWHKSQGKRAHWMGESGELQTLYVFKKQGPPKSSIPGQRRRALSTIVTIYDRVSERLSVSKPSPFGPSPVTRVEVSKTRFVKKNLTSLPFLKNPFDGLRVGFGRSQVTEGLSFWLRYLALRRSVSVDVASNFLGVEGALLLAFKNAEAIPVVDLLDPSAVWTHWITGLDIVGLKEIIENENAG